MRRLPIVGTAATAVIVVAAMALFGSSTVAAQGDENCNPPQDGGVWEQSEATVTCVGGSYTVEGLDVTKNQVYTFHDVTLTVTGEFMYVRGTSLQGIEDPGEFYVYDSTFIGDHPDAGRPILSVKEGATFHFIDSTMNGVLTSTVGEGDVLVERSRFLDGYTGIAERGNGVIRDSFFSGFEHAGIFTTGTTLIEDNVISGSKSLCVEIWGPGTPTIRGNTLTNCQVGIGHTQAPDDAYHEVHDNDVFWNRNVPRTCGISGDEPCGPTAEAGFVGDGTNNWWDMDPPDPTKLAGFDYDPWRTSPVHPERLPVASLSGVPSQAVLGNVFSVDASGSQSSSEFDFPLERFLWDFGDGTKATGSSASHSYSEPGTYTVQVRVVDEYGLSRSTEASVDAVNRNPVVQVSVSSGFAGEAVTASIQASDPDGTDPDVAVEWFKNGEAKSITADSVPASMVKSGDEWRIDVTATDEYGGQASASATAVIPNRAPAVTGMRVEPNEPRRGDALQAQVDVEDADGDGVTLAYQWHRNGQTTDQTARSVPGDLVVRGDSWSVTVTATDGHDETTRTSDVVTVQNTAPEVVSLSLDASEPGQDLEAAVEAADVDGDHIEMEYAWRQNGEARSDLTSPVVSGSEVVSGDEWILTVTPSDDALQGEAVSVKAVIGNHAPKVESLSVSPEHATAATPLEVKTVVSDEDDEDVDIAYAWLRNGEATQYDGSAVSAEHLVRGDSWRVRVSASDGKSEVKQLSASVVIHNTPPEVVNVEVEPQVPTMGESVVFSVDAVDLDGDALTVTWTLPDDSTLQAAATDWTFLQAGAATVSYQVSDGVTATTGQFTVEVQAVSETTEDDANQTQDDFDGGDGEDLSDVSDSTSATTEGDGPSDPDDVADASDSASATKGEEANGADSHEAPLPFLLAVVALVAAMRRHR